MRWYSTYIKILKWKKIGNTKCWPGCGTAGILILLVGEQISTHTLENWFIYWDWTHASSIIQNSTPGSLNLYTCPIHIRYKNIHTCIIHSDLQWPGFPRPLCPHLPVTHSALSSLTSWLSLEQQEPSSLEIFAFSVPSARESLALEQEFATGVWLGPPGDVWDYLEMALMSTPGGFCCHLMGGGHRCC